MKDICNIILGVQHRIPITDAMFLTYRPISTIFYETPHSVRTLISNILNLEHTWLDHNLP